MLKEKHTYFITVGTFHLVGPGGVPNLLRQAGYTVDGRNRERSANPLFDSQARLLAADGTILY